MDRAQFASKIDHTVLGPETGWTDVEGVLDEAIEVGTNACIPPCYVAEAAEYTPTVTLVTVCGFPHGQESTHTKVCEAERAWKDGADELDVVINLGRLLEGDTDSIGEELERIGAAVTLPLKVIVEAPSLTEDQLRTACELAEASGAAYVKTATGFGEGGATVEDVRIMAEYLPVKASGGIGTFEEAREMLEAGADRIGASAGIEILDGFDPDAFDA
ncbi:MAG: deoxyribose-phosphate aldolase [Natronomonas sp.]